MSTQITIENFEEIYNKTYYRTLKYIICKCNKLDDANDILQDTYVELYKNLKKKQNIEIEKVDEYIIGICKNIMKKYYKEKKQKMLLFEQDFKEDIDIKDINDLEEKIITKQNAQRAWKYIKTKNIIIVKVFYLYYFMEMKISEIANSLELKESNVKNYIYRTLRELNEKMKGGNNNAQ